MRNQSECKRLYLSTLNISQLRVYNGAYGKLNGGLGSSYQTNFYPKMMKRSPHNKTAATAIDHVTAFISQLHTVPAHYCRQDTKRQYLEDHFQTKIQLYNAYKEQCLTDNVEPVSMKKVVDVFKKFDISFHCPKKDQCAKCRLIYLTLKQRDLSEEEELEFLMHLIEKWIFRIQKKEKIASVLGDKKMMYIEQDMQGNVISPDSDIGLFWYMSRINNFNFTSYIHGWNKVVCVLWHEGLSGKDGVTMASARLQMLEYSLKLNSECIDLQLDGDGCAAQNRNQKESAAEVFFLENGDHNLQTITVSYGIPGHSPVQNVDQVHSIIDRVLKGRDLHSPLDFYTKLVNHCSPKFNKFHVIRLKQEHFLDFNQLSSQMWFKGFRFGDMKVIQYRKGDRNLYYKLHHGQDDWFMHRYQEDSFEIPKELPPLREIDFNIIPQQKQRNVEQCYAYIPLRDQIFFKEMFSVNDNRRIALRIAEGF